ncbi:hypothetical protein C900_03399 [Fulvivirga imtechensis AK7]|uniref:Lipocalin-like domain-containing protein n=1 Tax=Fulvivirga imtechensis AK7 TaxID=1237149 RepID=L8JPC9_9BACT|nr:DUF5004 domain-containing protein [Fulvivirga imtechensis]ELR70791.1 hypothetical protein C900_03399 [Fulvivirga imtechensis AK7]
MMKTIAFAFFALVIICSCDPGKKEETTKLPENEEEGTHYSLKMDMLGEWRNTSMKVKINADKGDSIINVPEGQWEERLKIKPIRTTFKEDGTYTSEYRDLEDVVIMTRTGTWSVKGDTLTMGEEGNTYSYATRIVGNEAVFEGYIDWDEDGQEDDLYWGKQQKQ